MAWDWELNDLKKEIESTPFFMGWRITPPANRLGFYVTGPYMKMDDRSIGPVVFIPFNGKKDLSIIQDAIRSAEEAIKIAQGSGELKRMGLA